MMDDCRSMIGKEQNHIDRGWLVVERDIKRKRLVPGTNRGIPRACLSIIHHPSPVINPNA
jgi:hypothetical protein